MNTSHSFYERAFKKIFLAFPLSDSLMISSYYSLIKCVHALLDIFTKHFLVIFILLLIYILYRNLIVYTVSYVFWGLLSKFPASALSVCQVFTSRLSLINVWVSWMPPPYFMLLPTIKCSCWGSRLLRQWRDQASCEYDKNEWRSYMLLQYTMEYIVCYRTY